MTKAKEIILKSRQEEAAEEEEKIFVDVCVV